MKGVQKKDMPVLKQQTNKNRQTIVSLIILLISCLLFCSCSKHGEDSQPLSVFWNDQVYFCYLDGKVSSDQISEQMILGKITLICDLAELPDENGEANFPAAKDAEIAEYNEMLYLRYSDGYWYQLHPRDGIK